jgi:hypothetical protein
MGVGTVVRIDFGSISRVVPRQFTNFQLSRHILHLSAAALLRVCHHRTISVRESIDANISAYFDCCVVGGNRILSWLEDINRCPIV